jgi:hypothetical protein
MPYLPFPTSRDVFEVRVHAYRTSCLNMNAACKLLEQIVAIPIPVKLQSLP